MAPPARPEIDPLDASSGGGSPRCLDLAIAAAALLLVSLQFEWIPPLRYAWGFNLWQYLPEAERWLLCVITLAVALPASRRAIGIAARRLDRGLNAAGERVLEWASIPVVAGLLWLVRERVLHGDSRVFLGTSHRGWMFVFPDVGSTFLFSTLYRAAISHSLPVGPILQISLCLCGGITAFLLLRTARAALPRRHSPTFLLLFVSSGAMVRIFAGHIEAYAYFLPVVVAYLWLSLEFLRSGRHWIASCGVLGVAVWLHLSALCLLPSLLLLPLLRDSRSDAPRALRRGVLGVGIAAIPGLAFVLALWALGFQEDLDRAGLVVQQILGTAEAEYSRRWLVRGWGDYPSIGTDYIFLSPGHLKYLLNAFYLLGPAALPVVLATTLRAPRRLVATGPARFLCTALTPLCLYAIVLRPFWGPFDWDLFAITALPLSVLAAHLMATWLPDRPFRALATAAVCFQLLFVGIPFLQIGIGTRRDAGPFVIGISHENLGRPATPPPEKLAPWL